MEEEKQKDIYAVFDRKTKVSEAGKVQIEERWVWSNEGVQFQRMRTTFVKYTDDEGNERVKPNLVTINEDVLHGDLHILSEIESEIMDSKMKRWHIKFKGEEYTGNYEEILEHLKYRGAVEKEDMLRSVLTKIISENEIKKIVAYPAIGFYISKVDGSLVHAIDKTIVYPALDSQKDYLESYLFKNRFYDEKNNKEMLQASSDFIKSLPDKTKQSALVARAFGTIAPLAYILKESPIRVFPYLYLYGEKGSSKTQIATVSCTSVFGDREILGGNAIDSNFRLGYAFSATTYPRVVDEAHDVFSKNISIFKSSATSTTATERGTKERGMDKYPALCSFCFTSNIPPIDNNDDSGGAMMDRILIAECVSGEGFNRELYNSAYPILLKFGFNYSKLVESKIKEELVSGVDSLLATVHTFANTFIQYDIENGKNIQQRRAYCLSEIVVGIEWYYRILDAYGVERPIQIDDLCKFVYDTLQKEYSAEENIQIYNFLTFVRSQSSRGMDKWNKMAEYGMFLSDATDADSDIVITGLTLDSYNKIYNHKIKYYRSLKMVVNDLRKIGIIVEEPSNNKSDNKSHWSIKIPSN